MKFLSDSWQRQKNHGVFKLTKKKKQQPIKSVRPFQRPGIGFHCFTLCPKAAAQIRFFLPTFSIVRRYQWINNIMKFLMTLAVSAGNIGIYCGNRSKLSITSRFRTIC